jgi:hypothetical protein
MDWRLFRVEYESCGESYTEALTFDQFEQYYHAAWADDSGKIPVKYFSRHDLDSLNRDIKGTYLVNHNNQVCIDLAVFIQENTSKGGAWDGWCMNPLSLLTACGNGRGGGDFYKGKLEYDNIGIWALDLLEYTNRAPFGYLEEKYYFDENKESIV